MYKNNSTSNAPPIQDAECSCFTFASNLSQPFLVKQKNQQQSPTPKLSQNNVSEINSPKGNIKKSLKREFLPFSQKNKGRLEMNNKNIEVSRGQQIFKVREIRGFMSPPMKKQQFNHKTYIQSQLPMNVFSFIRTPQKQIISYRNIPPQLTALYHPSPYFLPSPNIMGAALSPPKVIFTQQKIEPAPLVTSPLAGNKQPEKRTFSPISTKSNIAERKTVCSVIKPEKSLVTHYNYENDRSESTRIIQKIIVEPPSQAQAYKSCTKFSTMKSAVSPTKEKQKEGFLKLGTAKSGIQNIKQKIQASRQKQQNVQIKSIKSLNHLNGTLKKMDEVMEIHSQPDSDEHSDSDKESIVLDRLDQHRVSLTNTSKTNPSRLMRFNSLNTFNTQFGEQIRRTHQQFGVFKI